MAEGRPSASLLAEITADVGERAAVDESEIAVMRSMAVTWNDGSLGCPTPGMAYTQALVPGYWIVLEADGATYDYRVSARGRFRLCS